MNENKILNLWEIDNSVTSDKIIAKIWDNKTQNLESEDDCLKLINKHFPQFSPSLPFGRTDDCAEIFNLPNNIALSTDFFWENIHFRRRYMTPQEVGRKAISVAISDLAAAGSNPLGFSLGFFLPPKTSSILVEEIILGLSDIANFYNMMLTGGDLTCGKAFGFCSTVWGKSTKEVFLRRKQAEPGDIIFCNGVPGLAKAGLLALETWGRKAILEYPLLCKEFLAPKPNIEEGLKLFGYAKENHLNISLMDMSDGIAKDIPRLIDPYGADLQIEPSDLPAEFLGLCKRLRVKSEHVWISGGEEFILLGSCKEQHWENIKKLLPNAIKLGNVTKEHEIKVNGSSITIKGYDHLSNK